MLEGLSVGVAGGGDEHRVDLVLTGRPTPLTSHPAVHVNLVELSHPVEDVVHAGQRFPPANVELPHGLVPAHRVEARGTLRQGETDLGWSTLLVQSQRNTAV